MRYRTITGVQPATLYAAFCLQFNPFNVMFFQHGMFHTTYSDTIAAFFLFHYRYVFLTGCIHGVFFQPLHRLPAAMQFAGTGMYDFYHIAADCATVDFCLFRHNNLLFLYG